MPKYTDAVRLLCNQRAQVVMATKPPEIVVGPLTRRMIQTQRDLLAARKTIERCEARIRQWGLVIDGRSRTYSVRYDRQRRLRAEFDARQVRRQDAIRDLKIQAGIDLIDLPPSDAKRYLLRLKAKLDAI
jgi:hypothetical protein